MSKYSSDLIKLNPMHKSKALVLIANGSEEMEAVIIVDTLRRGNIDVTLCSTNPEPTPVTCSRGVVIKPDTALEFISKEHMAEFDIIVLPGGMKGAQHFCSPRVYELLADFKARHKWVSAICASPMVLSSSHHFPNLHATCYPGLQGKLDSSWKWKDEKVVVDGKVITSQGPGTAYDFALKIVEVLKGKEMEAEVRSGLLL